ncbi:MAG: hypothetical protein V9E95_13805 [Methanothrix soehngenii]
MTLGELLNRRIEGENIPGLEGNITKAETHLDELNNRLERRRDELAMERHLAIGDMEQLGRAWVLPHPGAQVSRHRTNGRDEEIERIAVQEAIATRGTRLARRERGGGQQGIRSDLAQTPPGRSQDIH